MAVTSIRSAAKDRLLDLITAAVQDADVTVSRWSTDVPREGIFLGQTTGSHEIFAMRAGRKSRIDRWSTAVDVFTRLPGVAESADGEARCEQLVASIEDVVANDPTLSGLPGLTHATLGRVDGPDAQASDEGWFAVMRVTVEFQAHLT